MSPSHIGAVLQHSSHQPCRTCKASCLVSIQRNACNRRSARIDSVSVLAFWPLRHLRQLRQQSTRGPCVMRVALDGDRALADVRSNGPRERYMFVSTPDFASDLRQFTPDRSSISLSAAAARPKTTTNKNRSYVFPLTAKHRSYYISSPAGTHCRRGKRGLAPFGAGKNSKSATLNPNKMRR